MCILSMLDVGSQVLCTSIDDLNVMLIVIPKTYILKYEILWELSQRE